MRTSEIVKRLAALAIIIGIVVAFGQKPDRKKNESKEPPPTPKIPSS